MESDSSHHNHHHGHDHYHENGKKLKYNLKVEGMSCTNCALGISRTLEKKHLTDVNVNFASGEVTFELPKNQKITIEEVIKTIESLGYVVLNKKNIKTPVKLFSLEKKFILSLIFTLPLVTHMFLSTDNILNNAWFQLILSIPVFIIGIMHFGKSAFYSVKSGIANMDVLIITGSGSAFLYSLIGSIIYYGSGEIHNYLFYETSSSIITLVLLGNLLEHRSVNQTTSAIEDLSKMQQVTTIKIIHEQGVEKQIKIEFADIKINDILLVNNGDKIPVDGEIIWGNGTLDESMISGESMPLEKQQHENVIGGTILLEGNLKIRAIKVGDETDGLAPVQQGSTKKELIMPEDMETPEGKPVDKKKKK